MEKNQILAQLKEVIRPYTENQDALENLEPETDFLKDLNINSANLVDIALDVEDHFGIEIDNTSMQQMLTVGAALDTIDKQLQNK